MYNTPDVVGSNVSATNEQVLPSDSRGFGGFDRNVDEILPSFTSRFTASIAKRRVGVVVDVLRRVATISASGRIFDYVSILVSESYS